MKKYNKLIIIGAGGHGRVVADIALKLNQWKEIYFLDDADGIIPFEGIAHIGKVKDYVDFIQDGDFIVAVGNNNIREKLLEELFEKGASLPVLVHPSAIIGLNVKIGVGTVIMAGVIINCGICIGKGVIINTASTIDHDGMIEDYVHVSPGVHVAGAVKVGKKTWIGIGCAVSNSIDITSNCMIGAGAVVVSDIMEKGTYVGVPARRLNKVFD